jgi:hypothetical protein
VPGTRLYYLHAQALSGPRTSVFLGTQHHLIFVADLDSHVPPEALRERVLAEAHLYPHLVDLEPAPGAPRVFEPASDDT